jgi:hypothetical protein
MPVNPSTWVAEAGGSPVSDLAELHSKTLSKTDKEIEDKF